MARMSKAAKQRKAFIDNMVNKAIQNVQINIFDLSKISKAAEDADAAGGDIEAALKEAVAKYRQN